MSKRGIVTRGQAFGPSGAWARRRRNNAKAPNRGGFLVRNFIDLGEYSVPPQKGAAYETASAQIFASWFWPGAISLSVGNYAVAGKQEVLKKTSLDSAQSGTYSLTGENETLKAGRKLSVQETPYTLTGEQITQLKTNVLKIQEGAYTTASQPVLKKKSILNAQETPYTLIPKPFDPVSLITGAGGFWRADNGVSVSSGNVTSWADQSSFAQTLSPSATAPTWSATGFNTSFPGVSFAGSAWIFNSSFNFPASSVVSVFVLLTFTSANTNYNRWMAMAQGANSDFNSSGGFAIEAQSNTNNFECDQNGVGVHDVGGTAPYNTPLLMGFVMSGGTLQQWIAGTTTGGGSGSVTGSPGGASSVIFALGAAIVSGTFTGASALTGTIALAGITQKNMSATDWSNLVGFCNANFGTSFSGGTGGASGNETLLWDRLDKAQAGSYALTGESEVLKKTSIGNAQSGFYSLSGENLGLKATRLLQAQMTPFALTGESITLAIATSALSMSLGTGTYALTDENLTLLKTSKAGAQSVAYSLTDESLTVLKSSKLVGSSGTYTLTGETLTLTAARRIKSQAGLYSLTGEPLALSRGSRLSPTAGAYSLTGEALMARATHIVSVVPGVYTVTGGSATVTQGTTTTTTIVGTPRLFATLIGPALSGDLQ